MPVARDPRFRAPSRGRRFPTILLALVAVCLLLPGASAASSRQDDAEANDLLQRAAETMAGLDSFHFELSTPRGQTLFMENLELAGLGGDVQRPDRFRANVAARAAIVELSVRVVGIGTRLWVTNPMSQDEAFQEIDLGQGTADGGTDGAALVDLLNPDRILLQAVERIDEPTVVGEDEIDGTTVTRVDGTVDLSQIRADGTPVPGLLTDDPLPVSIWIDDAGRVVRLELDGPLTTAEPPDVLRRLDLSAFDEPIDIQPPV
ncbi:MAG: LppX_LprAFG lipoprotein [Chloroflexota bacterium]|nr:LppX_LprAFG lipoprotein [Chloroflexota bacterium]